jgi:hypothetical protein
MSSALMVTLKAKKDVWGQPLKGTGERTQVYDVGIFREYLVLLAEFGGKGERRLTKPGSK